MAVRRMAWWLPENPGDPAAFSFPFIFGFSVSDALPLHIRPIISAAAGQRDNMIDHPAWAGAFWLLGQRARLQGFEVIPGGGAAMSQGLGWRQGQCENYR